MKESIEKAAHDIGFLRDDLQDALKKSGRVEGVLVLRLIKKAADLQNEIDMFLDALAAARPDGLQRTWAASAL